MRRHLEEHRFGTSTALRLLDMLMEKAPAELLGAVQGFAQWLRQAGIPVVDAQDPSPPESMEVRLLGCWAAEP